MNCNEASAILDSHRSARLTPAERASVDEHLSVCEDCGAAWLAQTELLAVHVPPLPATLLERVLLALRAPPRAEPRRAWPTIAVGTALLAGAALAGITIVSMTGSPSVEAPSSAGGEPSAQAGEALVDAAPAAATPAAAAPGLPTSVELVETSHADVIPLVRHNPTYPAQALAQKLDGHVQLEFDITTAGTVENVSVVESSDAQFEQPAIDALSKWRYLPRLTGGKRVRHDGVHTIIRFVLTAGDEAPPPRQAEVDAAVREYAAYTAGLEVALDRLAADDFRGVELQLDEMQALYGANRADLWSFYGYLFTVQGSYDRAIDAYERCVAIYLPTDRPTSGPWARLANLYYARHQYDVALATLLRPERVGKPVVRSREVNALMEKLRALGVTEETLVGR